MDAGAGMGWTPAPACDGHRSRRPPAEGAHRGRVTPEPPTRSRRSASRAGDTGAGAPHPQQKEHIGEPAGDTGAGAPHLQQQERIGEPAGDTGAGAPHPQQQERIGEPAGDTGAGAPHPQQKEHIGEPAGDTGAGAPHPQQQEHIAHADQIDAYSVTAQYIKYICPEGQNVNLTCTITGHPKEQHEQLAIHWTYSRERHPDCADKKHSGDKTENDLHDAHKRDFLHGKVFHKTITNISALDSGGYCCFLHEKHNRHISHSYIDLQVKTDDANLKTCSFFSHDQDNDGTTAGALAIVACIVGILCLPLILVLVYKQRKAVTNRRAQELVRMDSEAGFEGLDNPVFDDPPVGHPEQRPKLIFMASRQPSDSGRHLLSEPNTPLSPYGPNDCFFPSLDPVPDSPDPV